MLLGKIKLYDIAKELNLTSKEVLEIAKKLNIDAKSHLSSVGEAEADKRGRTKERDYQLFCSGRSRGRRNRSNG